MQAAGNPLLTGLRAVRAAIGNKGRDDGHPRNDKRAGEAAVIDTPRSGIAYMQTAITPSAAATCRAVSGHPAPHGRVANRRIGSATSRLCV